MLDVPTDYQHVGLDERFRAASPGVAGADESPDEQSFVLLRSLNNKVGGIDVVLPWWSNAQKGTGAASKQRFSKKEETTPAQLYAKAGKHALRVLSAAMVCQYFLSKDNGLNAASVGTQIYHLWFPVLTAYTAGVYIAPVGLVLYGLNVVGARF